MTTQGRRIEHLDHTTEDGIKPGDYWKDDRGHWHVAAPVPRDDDGFLLSADVSTWDSVTEHEDGTITVSPSIFWGAGGYPNSPPEWAAKHIWHGFLDRGIWRSV
jgi:hypothetical protein